MNAADHITEYKELISRESNGISVSLLWNRTDNSLKVAVYDTPADACFELDVADAAPLEVFNHPYAYAAFRAIDNAHAFEPTPAEALAA